MVGQQTLESFFSTVSSKKRSACSELNNKNENSMAPKKHDRLAGKASSESTPTAIEATGTEYDFDDDDKVINKIVV